MKTCSVSCVSAAKPYHKPSLRSFWFSPLFALSVMHKVELSFTIMGLFLVLQSLHTLYVLCFGNGSSFLQNTESSVFKSAAKPWALLDLSMAVSLGGWRFQIFILCGVHLFLYHLSSITSFLKMVTLSKKLSHGAFMFPFDEQRTPQTCITSTFIFEP